MEIGNYTFERTEGNPVRLRFCSWSLSRFCELAGGLSFTDFLSLLADSRLTLDHIALLLQSGAEYVAEKEGKPELKISKLEAHDLLDEMGGYGSPEFNRMFSALSESIAPRRLAKDEPTDATPKKKGPKPPRG